MTRTTRSGILLYAEPVGRAGPGAGVPSARANEANRVRARAPATRRMPSTRAIYDPAIPTRTCGQTDGNYTVADRACSPPFTARRGSFGTLIFAIFVENEMCSS